MFFQLYTTPLDIVNQGGWLAMFLWRMVVHCYMESIFPAQAREACSMFSHYVNGTFFPSSFESAM